MRRYAVLAALLASLVLAGEAAAKVVTLHDDDGRDIVLDLRAKAVDTKWYADLLRRATHGDEISTVTVRIVRRDALVRLCGPGANGCYERTRGGARIVVPAGRNADVAHTLLHEYAHHIDHTRTHRGLREPNGTRAWWAARKHGVRLKRGKVAFGYQLGWSRSVGEIFAEDYTQTQLRTEYGIPWLAPPNGAVRAALARDLGVLPAEPAQPDVDPLVLRRAGTIDAGRRLTMPFGLVGPDRRVTFTVTMQGKKRVGARAQLLLTCGETRVTKSLRRGAAVARIDRRGLGPAQCQVTLINTAGKSLAFNATLRLAVQA